MAGRNGIIWPGIKCRLFPIQQETQAKQADTVFSDALTYKEQAENCIGTCKTYNSGFSNENAASTGMDHGVNSIEKPTKVRAKCTPKRGRSAISKFAKDSHKRAARGLGYALILGDAFGWKAVTAVWAARLTAKERASLAFSALASLDYDDAVLTARMCLGDASGPLPAFIGGMEEARFWAENATPIECKAYALAAYEALTKSQKSAFRLHIASKGCA